MNESQDAFGHVLLDYLDGRETFEVIERDDGFLDVSARASEYFRGFDEWSAEERDAVASVRGRVLDVGCGAGRFALHLQERGHDVVAIDISPLAVGVCRRRGVADARVLSITRIGPGLGRFDTVLMLGNNFGLFGTRHRARRLLRRFHRRTSARGRIVAQVVDPYQTTNPAHLEYHERNRRRGRMCGQLRLRVRYQRYTTPWFDYLFVSRPELDEIVEGSGWRVEHVIGAESPIFIIVLEKEG